ncbi:MFS transporter [Streptomyces platensis]|uniref:MFS transporter n=1 Tax=Streptomyces platensis TaxID=58346 RepID=UPI0030E3E302
MSATEAAVARGRSRSPLRTANFRFLWLGESLSGFAFQGTQFLLPLLALTAAGSSAFGVGLVSAAQFLPTVVLSLLAGGIVGRFAVRGLLVVCNVLRGGTLGLLGALCAVDEPTVALLAAVALAVGAVTVFHDVGYQAAVPRVLGPDQLTTGNGLSEASYSVAQMAGPALAGAAVQHAGLPATAAFAAAAFLGALVCFGPLRIGPADGPETQRPLRTVVSGLKFTWRSHTLRDLCVQSALFNLHEQAFLTAFMVFAVRSLHLSSGTVGLVLGLGSLGALLGSLWVGRMAARLHVGAAVSWSLTVCAVALLGGTALTSVFPGPVALAAAFFVNGVALAVYNVFVLSLRGALAPAEHMAMVMAGYRLVSMAPVPLGALIGGLLVEAVGAFSALVAIAASLTLASLALRRSPVREIRRLTDPADAPSGPS